MTWINWRAPARATLDTVEKVAWALFLVCLPVTSFPYFPPAIGGGVLVRPLSLYPLIALLIVATLPRMIRKPLPKTLLTLVPFGMIALASSLLATLRDVDPLLGVTMDERILRALLTLGLGAAIYYTVSLLPRSHKALRTSLGWLYAGFVIALLWGSLQAVYIVNFEPGYFRLLQKVQDHISVRQLFTTRISGLTYEPNWFAEQISFLLLPWLLASVSTGYSVFPWRWRWLTVEWLLLGWSMVVLAFTFSRAGLITLITLAFLSALFFRTRRGSKAPVKQKSTKKWLRRVVEAAVAVLILVGLIYTTGTKNEFFSRIWNYWNTEKSTSLSNYFEYLGFGARFTYGEAAYRTYETHPVLGVGLGNYAFYFEDMLPDRPLAAKPEILRILTPDVGRNRLITPKNLYLRLLAETGLVGTATFMAFLVSVAGSAIYLWLAPNKETRFWGTAGLLGIIAFLLSAFSFDSFAIPNMWVVFGLITAATGIQIQRET